MGAACLSVCLLLATPQCVQCTLVSGKEKKQTRFSNVDACPRSLTKGSKNDRKLKLTHFSVAKQNKKNSYFLMLPWAICSC